MFVLNFVYQWHGISNVWFLYVDPVNLLKLVGE